MGSRHTRSKRLRTAAEFDRVFKRGRRLPGPLFLLVAAHNQAGVDRLGLAVGRRVGGAVGRNRARRLLRESFRRTPRAADGQGYDLVVVAQREIAGSTQAEVDHEWRRRLRGLAPGTRGQAAARPD